MYLSCYSLRAFFFLKYHVENTILTILFLQQPLECHPAAIAAAASCMVNKGLGLVLEWRDVQCSPWIGVNKHLRRYLALPETDTGLPAPAQWTVQTSRDHSRSFDTKSTKFPSRTQLCMEPGGTGNTVQRASASGGAKAPGGQRLAKKRFL